MKYVFNILILAVVAFVLVKTFWTESRTVRQPETQPAGEEKFSGAKSVKTCRKGFDIPQSVVLDETKSVVYVSNSGRGENPGYICKASLSGEVIDTLKTGTLENPKGLALRDGFLYAASGKNLVQYSLDGDSVVKKTEIKDAGVLNDVVILPQGTVYVSDSAKNCIFRLGGADGAEVFFKDTLGITAMCSAGGILTAASGKILRKISPEGRTEMRQRLKFTPAGICPDGKGAFIMPAKEGGIFAVSDSLTETLLKTKSGISGKMEYVGCYGLLFAPSAKNNALEIYEIGQYFQSRE